MLTSVAPIRKNRKKCLIVYSSIYTNYIHFYTFTNLKIKYLFILYNGFKKIKTDQTSENYT